MPLKQEGPTQEVGIQCREIRGLDLNWTSLFEKEKEATWLGYATHCEIEYP